MQWSVRRSHLSNTHSFPWAKNWIRHSCQSSAISRLTAWQPFIDISFLKSWPAANSYISNIWSKLHSASERAWQNYWIVAIFIVHKGVGVGNVHFFLRWTLFVFYFGPLLPLSVTYLDCWPYLAICGHMAIGPCTKIWASGVSLKRTFKCSSAKLTRWL